MKRGLFALAGICVACVSQATTLWDYGMSTGGYNGGWVNQNNGQEFADMAVFTSAVTVTRYIYFTVVNPASFGTMHVKMFADAGGGVPGGSITTQDVSPSGYSIDGVYGGDTVWRVALDLSSSVNFNAGTYWFGASGNGFDAGQVALRDPAPGDGRMAQFGGGTYSGFTVVGDQAFQLEGTVVPEPATFAVFGLGIAAVGLLKRRRNG